jgi:tRNA (guanine-N7-)-methyltransferase
MRMRRKKHREERLEACSHLIISNIEDYKDDIKAVFGDDKPLRIEIGCGKGKFILETATNNPDINFIAVEKCSDVLVLAAEKIKEAGLTNVKFIQGDVMQLACLETKTKCEVIYINFCDPWMRSGYAKRRLTHGNFLTMYEKWLEKGGSIHFKTDNTKLYEFSLNSFSDYGLKLKNITLDLHSSKFEGNVMTEYETNFTNLGQPIYRCEASFNNQDKSE